jgi:hypothetical protein
MDFGCQGCKGWADRPGDFEVLHAIDFMIKFFKITPRCSSLPCRIPGVFCRRKPLSRYRRTHGPLTYADCCLARRQPIRTGVYPRVLRQRRVAQQLLYVSLTIQGNVNLFSRVSCHTVATSQVPWWRIRSRSVPNTPYFASISQWEAQLYLLRIICSVYLW